MKKENFGEKHIFLPDATLGTVKFVPTHILKSLNIKGLVINTLHLWTTLGPKKIKKLGGMHKIMGWDGWLLSDSGGFQVFSLIHRNKWKGEINKNGAVFKDPTDGTVYKLTPEKSIDIQIALGTDVLVVLDDCRDAEISRKSAEKSVENTIKWAERCKTHFENKYGGRSKTGKLISCVIQGANYADLRAKCAKELTKIGFDGYNFGGYVVNKKGELAVEAMQAAIENTPKDKFHYAMGVGKPEDIIRGSQLGYKVFDTVLVTRNARHGTLYSFENFKNSKNLLKDIIDNPEGLIVRIRNAQYEYDKTPIDTTCNCPSCQNYSKAYLRHLYKCKEATAMQLTTMHNLYFYQRLITEISKEI